MILILSRALSTMCALLQEHNGKHIHNAWFEENMSFVYKLGKVTVSGIPPLFTVQHRKPQASVKALFLSSHLSCLVPCFSTSVRNRLLLCFAPLVYSSDDAVFCINCFLFCFQTQPFLHVYLLSLKAVMSYLLHASSSC